MFSNIIVKTFIFNILMILFFSVVYYVNSPKNFIKVLPQGQKRERHSQQSRLSYVDALFYSTTIQSTIGLADIHTTTEVGKMIVLVQQWLVLGTGFILLYSFYDK